MIPRMKWVSKCGMTLSVALYSSYRNWIDQCSFLKNAHEHVNVNIKLVLRCGQLVGLDYLEALNRYYGYCGNISCL